MYAHFRIIVNHMIVYILHVVPTKFEYPQSSLGWGLYIISQVYHTSLTVVYALLMTFPMAACNNVSPISHALQYTYPDIYQLKFMC